MQTIILMTGARYISATASDWNVGGNPSLVQNSVLSSRKYLQGSKPGCVSAVLPGAGWPIPHAVRGRQEFDGFFQQYRNPPESTPKRSTRGCHPTFLGHP